MTSRSRAGWNRRAQPGTPDGAALEHQADYPTETIDGLMQEADVGENEAAAMFEDLTGKPLRPG